MKQLYGFLLLFLLVSHTLLADAFIDTKLREALTPSTSSLQVVVSFKSNAAPTQAHLTLLQQLGIKQGVIFKALPIAGIIATPAQVQALAQNPEVLSIYLNTSMKSENEEATALTGVDRLRKDAAITALNKGLPVTGKGVGILVNDSGVDGTHPDLLLGKNLKQNVLATANLNAINSLLPYVVIENVPNTDVLGGHGTHVAGIAGGTGAASNGKFEGVAPGANLIGYGSGAGLMLVDILSAFDYAITHQQQYNIRVITNSFGPTNDAGTEFNPQDPVNIATKKCADHNIVVVFSAGNSGPTAATITGNYKKAPWVVTVAAGDKSGRLADFSSRGIKDRSGSFTMDGQVFTWQDRPTVTAPGVSIASTRTISPNGLQSIPLDALQMDPTYLPYYTYLDGTSMAAPHVAGIIALILEANPSLTPYQVKDILQKTATNIPAKESWEAGAGYVNAHAAVDAAFRGNVYTGEHQNYSRVFKSTIQAKVVHQSYSLQVSPLSSTQNTHSFEVPAGVTGLEVSLKASGLQGETGNLVDLVLVSPSGATYSSGISILFSLLHNKTVNVASPEPGTWTIKAESNGGLVFAETMPGNISLTSATVTSGLGDIAGHPSEDAIKLAINNRLVDGLTGGYKPDELLKRLDLADYLMMGQGIRQYLPTSGSVTFTDAKDKALLIESVTAKGAALRDLNQEQAGVMQALAPGKFSPTASVTRASLAYSLVQSLGLGKYALERTGKPVYVNVNGQRVLLADAAQISPGLEGYVSVALELNLINTYVTTTPNSLGLTSTVQVTFKPNDAVTRGDFAVIITRTFQNWTSATQPVAAVAAPIQALALATVSSVAGAYPNPFEGTTHLRYSVEAQAPVSVEVFNLQGRKVKTLLSAIQNTGSYDIPFEAKGLSAGIYMYKITVAGKVQTGRMLLAR